MASDNKPRTVSVRQGVAPGVVRYVLIVSMILAVIALIAVAAFF
jgi:hypothetical protein